MPIEIVTARGIRNDKRDTDEKGAIGNWEVHSWGHSKFPGMAAISAITTLQIGATLSPLPADKIALNNAVEYLMDALSPQLKSFQHALVAE